MLRSVILPHHNDAARASHTQVQTARDQVPSSSVTYSMLISESVYRLVVICERLIRWFNRAVLRPFLFYFRVLIS